MKASYLLPAALAVSGITLLYAGPPKAAIVLLAVAVLDTYVAWQQTGYSRRMVERSKLAIGASHRSTFSSPLQKKLVRLTVYALCTAVLLALILLLSGAHTLLDPKTKWLILSMLLVAALPASLPLQLSALMHWAPPKRTAALAGYAVRSSAAMSMALVLVVMASFVGLAGWHVPIALTVLQILLVQFVFQLLTVTALAWDEKTHTSHVSWVNELGFSFIAAAVSYGNYLFFFARNDISPMHISTANPYYFQATTVALVTLVLCHAIGLLLMRRGTRKQLFTAQLWSNHTLLAAFGLSFVILLSLFYLPSLHTFLGMQALGWMDWLWAVAGTVIYLGTRLLQRHTLKHSRQAVLSLHKQVAHTKRP